MLLIVGDADTTVPPEQSAQMADRLVSFGIVEGSSPCMMNSIYTNSP